MRHINTVLTFILIMLFFTTSIHASPTKNEFIPCKKLAVASLEHCLKNDDQQCWAISKKRYASCRKDVIQSHISDFDRINAKKNIKPNMYKAITKDGPLK